VTRVMIFSAIRLYREGIGLILRVQRGMRPVGDVADIASALLRFREIRPDVVLVDGAMPDAVDTVRTLVAAEPDMRIVVLGVEDDLAVLEYAEAGVSGYVTRSADTRSLAAALETVAAGGALCSPPVAAALLKRVATLSARDSYDTRAERLTLCEREIVELVQDGLSNKEISQRLCIEVATVKNHVHNILDKLDVHRRADVAAALRA
jgi:two-component system, NarL family, nitrate/nitrite response regulator NarL